MNEDCAVNQVLGMFVAASVAKFNSHAYASGYLSSMVIRLIKGLPENQQELYISQLLGSIEDIK